MKISIFKEFFYYLWFICTNTTYYINKSSFINNSHLRKYSHTWFAEIDRLKLVIIFIKFFLGTQRNNKKQYSYPLYYQYWPLKFSFSILFKSNIHSKLDIPNLSGLNIKSVNIMSCMKNSFFFISNIESLFCSIHDRVIKKINVVFSEKMGIKTVTQLYPSKKRKILTKSGQKKRHHKTTHFDT